MKNFNKLIPQSLRDLIEEGNFSEANARVLREQQTVSDNNNINHYERNQHFGHLEFQRAVIASAQNQLIEAFGFAKKSFQFDAFTFPYHQALIELALPTKTEEAQLFASEIAWLFLTSHEYLNSTYPINFWSKEDQDYAEKNGLSLREDASAITATLEKYRDLPIINQRLLENELFFARIELDDLMKYLR